MTSLILGSASPRRKQILSYFNLPFEVAISPFNESSLPYLGDAEEYVVAMARGKAEALVMQYPEQPILTADTVVVRKGRLYEKPRDPQEAFETLSALVGATHEVFTGVALSQGSQIWTQLSRTEVTLVSLSEEEIRHYQEAIHSYDKAGGYGIQGAGSAIVESIHGCFYNVMGLPIQPLRKLLKEVGIDLWEHLEHC